jgi:hypothetical protein
MLVHELQQDWWKAKARGEIHMKLTSIHVSALAVESFLGIYSVLALRTPFLHNQY